MRRDRSSVMYEVDMYLVSVTGMLEVLQTKASILRRRPLTSNT